MPQLWEHEMSASHSPADCGPHSRPPSQRRLRPAPPAARPLLRRHYCVRAVVNVPVFPPGCSPWALGCFRFWTRGQCGFEQADGCPVVRVSCCVCPWFRVSLAGNCPRSVLVPAYLAPPTGFGSSSALRVLFLVFLV